VESLPAVDVCVGRLDTAQMTALLRQSNATLVIDATHPYAVQASRNISQACKDTGVSFLRVLRESAEEQGCITFTSTTDLLAWLEQKKGNIFVTTGASHAEVFIKLRDYRNRVWLRILPNMDSLCACQNMGYRPDRLICMQGPFSEELNRAMFESANAKILVTKNSGAAGGFYEKTRAAQSLGILTAVLSKPDEANGISLDEALKRVMELMS
jgi:precorrin-6x reductase